VTDTPYGPIKITPNRQVSLPKELMDRARLQPGDRVYVSWNDQFDNTFVVIPIEIVAQWIRRGQHADAPAHTELPSIDPPV
jgi:hypothetical protein